VGTFTEFKEAEVYLRDHAVDVLLIDDALPANTNIVQEVKLLLEVRISLSIIVILQRPTASLVQRLMEQGVGNILNRNDDLEEVLVQAISWAKKHGIQLSPAISRLINAQRALPAALNQRDIDVLRLLADGLEPKEIAVHLGVGSNTIYRILRALREKFNAQSNAQLVDIAHQMKLFEPQE
jgi:DNA-binding NarL/FixJ family response regulator